MQSNIAAANQIDKITNANELVSWLSSIGNVIIYLLIAFAVVYIVWNIVIYFVKGKAGDENRKEAGQHLMWGIVGLAIILSVWGLVNIILGTFRTDNNAPKDRFPTADFINSQSGQNAVQYQTPSFQNNWNTNITGGNENTDNYNH